MDRYNANDKVRITNLHAPASRLKTGMTGVIVSPKNNGFEYFDYGVKMDDDGATYLLHHNEIERFYTPFRA